MPAMDTATDVPPINHPRRKLGWPAFVSCLELQSRWSTLRFSLRALSVDIATPIAHFVSHEFLWGPPLRGWMIPSLGQHTAISILRIEPVVDFALKTVRPMKPRTSANEDTGIEPFRAIVAVSSAVMRNVVIVAVGAIGGDSNVKIDLSRSV